MQKLFQTTKEQKQANPKFPDFKGELVVDGKRKFCSVWIYETSMSIDFQDSNANQEKLYPENDTQKDYGVRMTMTSENGNPYGDCTLEFYIAFNKNPEKAKAAGYVIFGKEGKWYAGKKR